MRWPVAAAVVTALALGSAIPARAATTWHVTGVADGTGSCVGSSCTTLRAAVGAAATGDTVLLPASGNHFALTLGEIQITKPLTIVGGGAKATVVDAGGHSRVFEITSGVAATQTVTFRALTITGGKVTSLTSAAPGGAGVAVDTDAGSVVFRGAAVSGNTVNALSTNAAGTRLAGGGGILQNGGQFTFPDGPEVGGNVTVIDSTVSGNRLTLRGDGDAPGGGGIKNDQGNTHVVHSVISGNTVNDTHATGDDQGGGGIENRGENVAILHSTIEGNVVTSSKTSPFGTGGGGINDADGHLRVVSSTISGNLARVGVNHDAGGGGVFDGTRHAVWVNSTVAGNRTDVPAGVRTGGGGIYLATPQTARFSNVTVARNSSAHAPGGGIFASNGEGTVNIKSSIVALNRSGVGGANCGGGFGKTFISVGHNLESDGGRSCRFTRATDLVSSAPRLGALGRNGGPTPTVALLSGSPAIDRIPLASCTDQSSPSPKRVVVDQRGRRRPDGLERRCDIGAYESRG